MKQKQSTFTITLPTKIKVKIKEIKGAIVVEWTISEYDMGDYLSKLYKKFIKEFGENLEIQSSKYVHRVKIVNVDKKTIIKQLKKKS